MQIKCLKSRNPALRAGVPYTVVSESEAAWVVRDSTGHPHRCLKNGGRWVGAEGWKVVRCNPDVESGPAIQFPACGKRVLVTPTFGALPWVPYPAKFMGTFDAGAQGTGIMVQDAEGYLIHIWPNTAKWEVVC